jgi:hypothetical protein
VAFQTASIKGHISRTGAGAIKGIAKSVEIVALGASSQSTPVATSPVKDDGTFDASLPANASPSLIFIVKILDIGGAVLGAGVVNGLPAFLKGFLVDVPVDTLTTFKAQILDTIAKGGVPGVQNYLNVLDAFINGELAGDIAVESVAATDVNSLITAVADAVIAGEDAIVSALKAVGIPVDMNALTQGQAAVVSGIEGLVTSASNELISVAKNLVAGFEAAGAKAAAPIDQAIFNAIVNGGVAFKGSFTGACGSGTISSATAFAASKSVFGLQASVTVDNIKKLFQNVNNPNVTATLTNGGAVFLAQIAQSKSTADLNAAKAGFTNTLLAGNGSGGGNALLQILVTIVADLRAVVNSLLGPLEPLIQALTAALTQPCVAAADIGAAIDQFDKGAAGIADTLETVVSSAEAIAISGAVKLVQKVIAL